ncbi:adenylate/guanylate cyclase domain-containing protein [Bauldia sp.]|uniref:adenylate/guanylate cyclase domain-containing protein n=1 Tax=Bauldia sp. TaxID=2575872 RepID=UPI003BACB02B
MTSSDDGQTRTFGIKARLSLAFGIMAALTVAVGVIAWLVFGEVERAVTSITEGTVLEITLAHAIAERTAEITATAPAIVTSRSQEERQEERARLDSIGEALTSLIAEWRALGLDADAVQGLDTDVENIRSEVAAVDRAVANRIVQAAQREAKTAALSDTHTRFLEILEPMIDDSVFDMVIGSEARNAEAGDSVKAGIEDGAARLTALLSLKAEINRAAGLIREFTHDNGPGTQTSLVAAATSVSSEARRLANSVAGIEGADGLRESVERVLDFAPEPGVQVDLQRLAVAQQSFLDTVDAMIDAAQAALTTTTEAIIAEQTTSISELVDVGAMTLNALLVLRAEGNLAAGLLNEAANVSDIDRLNPIAERFTSSAGQIERSLAVLSGERGLEDLRSTVGVILQLGKGHDNLFTIRRSELLDIESAQVSLDAARVQSDEFHTHVAELVAVAEADSATVGSAAEDVAADGRWLIVVVAIGSLLGAVLVMYLYVRPGIVRPIESITKSMSVLADGDTSIEIPGRDRSDELGRMAEALSVFRDITVQIQKSNLREIEAARSRLQDAIESISEAFSLYDADDRLVVCNEMYGRLVHPEIRSEIKPGITFTEILRKALAKGYIAEAQGRDEEWFHERMEAHRNPGEPKIMQRTDGIWIMVSERVTAEGGVVAVYSDITEMKERETELAEKSQALEQLSNQLSKYLSPQVYQSIFTGEQAAVVAGKRKKLTVFFSDLVGFTETADRLESEDLTQILNHYLTEMSNIALAHGATIDKFVGDAIMIFFGDPVSRGLQADAVACVKMAIAMQNRLAELADSWRALGFTRPLRCRIGITTGFCTVGNFGSENRMDYTIIGGPVNLASRLEGAAEPGSILVSGETYELIKDQIACEEQGTISVKGIAYPVSTFRVIDTLDNIIEKAGRIAEHRGKISVDADLAAMSEQERQEAAGLLRKILAEIGDEKR